MPRLPPVDELHRPTPQPARGVVGFHPPIDSGVEGKAIAELGLSVAEVGNELAEPMEDEAERMDTLRAEEVTNFLLFDVLEFKNGEDGFVKRRGKDAISKDFLAEYTSRFNDTAKELEKLGFRKERLGVYVKWNY